MIYKRLIRSIKLKLGLKGRINDFFNPFALKTCIKITRKEKVYLDEKILVSCLELIKKKINFKNSILIASEIWREALEKRLSKIEFLISNKDLAEIKNIYENLYLSDLMEGAVSHQNNLHLIKRISQGTRFHFRKKLVEKIIKKNNRNYLKNINNLITSDIYNFGRPFAHPIINNKKVNIEYPDELYFSEFIFRFLKLCQYDEITFIGDGSGLLAPLVVYSNKELLGNINCKYRIIDFAHFAISTFLRINSEEKNIYINLPEEIHKFSNNKALEGSIPKIKGKRLIINQDSFPEMSNTSLKTYLKNQSEETHILSYNQRAGYNKKHSDHIELINQLNYKLIHEENSQLRDDYYLSFYKPIKN